MLKDLDTLGKLCVAELDRTTSRHVLLKLSRQHLKKTHVTSTSAWE